jgi:putative RNA 2'-phosphotransferase
VDLGLTAIDPPPILFHGTAERFISSILATGLQKRQLHHVHLSENKDTAIQVGRRYGVPVLLAVDARQMAHDGVSFYQADNQVWLTDEVPSRYLTIVSTE